MRGVKGVPAMERIMEKVAEEDRGFATPCWVFRGSRNKAGYGVIKDDGHHRYAHRLTYVDAKGAIPEGLEIDHLCRVRECCNPEHLEAVTRLVNVRRGLVPMVQKARFVHWPECKHGHAYTDENTYWYTYSTGYKKRFCRTCSIEGQRRRRLERMASA